MPKKSHYDLDSAHLNLSIYPTIESYTNVENVIGFDILSTALLCKPTTILEEDESFYALLSYLVLDKVDRGHEDSIKEQMPRLFRFCSGKKARIKGTLRVYIHEEKKTH